MEVRKDENLLMDKYIGIAFGIAFGMLIPTQDPKNAAIWACNYAEPCWKKDVDA